MAKKEQVRPLAPAVSRPFRSDDQLENNYHNHNHHQNDNKNDVVFGRRRDCIKYCGCASAILVIAAVTLIVLAFTAFHVRGPIVTMNSIAAAGGGDLTGSGENVTLIADLSVKNPNSASLRYGNTTTAVFYGGAAVGEGLIPAGLARARRTVRTNMTVVIVTRKVFDSPRLTEDLASGSLTMESFTRIEGRVKIANIVKKKVVVKLNCTMTYNISSRRIQKQGCKTDVNI